MGSPSNSFAPGTVESVVMLISYFGTEQQGQDCGYRRATRCICISAGLLAVLLVGRGIGSSSIYTHPARTLYPLNICQDHSKYIEIFCPTRCAIFEQKICPRGSRVGRYQHSVSSVVGWPPPTVESAAPTNASRPARTHVIPPTPPNGYCRMRPWLCMRNVSWYLELLVQDPLPRCGAFRLFHNPCFLQKFSYEHARYTYSSPYHLRPPASLSRAHCLCPASPRTEDRSSPSSRPPSIPFLFFR